MGFKQGKRTGGFWDDVTYIDGLLKKGIDGSIMNINGDDEKAFENRLSSILDARQDELSSKVITQQNKETTVQSVFCFGKNHRPDMTIGEDGIAIEVKYINGTNGLNAMKMALGQSLMYRVRYRFVINVIVISEDYRDVYNNLLSGVEKDFEDILKMLADKCIYTYVVPCFKLKKGQKLVFEVNGFDKLTDKDE